MLCLILLVLLLSRRSWYGCGYHPYYYRPYPYPYGAYPYGTYSPYDPYWQARYHGYWYEHARRYW